MYLSAMDFQDQELQRYIEAHTTPESDVLAQINRDTHIMTLKPRMLSGHLQGRMLAMISQMVRPSRILEIGTFTGYSAVCLAEGLQEGGKLITLDINEELEDRVRRYFELAGLSKKIDYRIGNALTIIPTLNEMFDLVFIDGDKENYARYFELVVGNVRPGGFIVADNVLWSGKVIGGMSDKKTSSIVAFNAMIQRDSRVENVLLPVRDGIMIMRKVSL